MSAGLTGLHFLTFPKMPVPNPVQMDSVSIKMLHGYQKEYGQSVRQQSVHSFSTKDKPGTLPIGAYLQKEPQIIPLTLSDGVHQPDEQPLHQPDHQTIILPSGTAAAVQGRSCLIITSEDVTSAAQTVNVVWYNQSPTDCLQFVHSEETEINVTDLVIVDLDELTVN